MTKRMVKVRAEGDDDAMNSLDEILHKNKDGLTVLWKSKTYLSDYGVYKRVYYDVNVPIMEENSNEKKDNNG